MAPNPFTPMLLTYNPRYVFGRQNTIISILQVITAHEPNGHAIYGIRTIGKTTMLKYLKDANGALQRYEPFVNIDYRAGGSKQLLFVYINFHDFSEGDSLFYIMLEQLQNEIPDAGFPPYDDTISRQKLTNILRRILIDLEDRQVRVVFLLDDFDIPLNYLDENDDRLLRNLSDSAALIIATEAPISQLRPDIGESSPLLGILRPESIGLLTEDEALSLIREPLAETDISFTEEEETFLLDIAGRQPFLLTAACEFYYDMRVDYPEMGSLLLEPDGYENLQRQFIYRLSGLPHVDNLLNRIWRRLIPDERRALFSMTQHIAGQINFAAQLANKGLAYWDLRDGNYRVFNRLFETYIGQNYTPSSERDTQPAPSVLENLTPIDRTLLEYFLNRVDEVCTFDELLNAVWEDQEKSKRALEAAVFRLRKHLQEGEHIKNIRGKGYKFVIEDFANT